MKDTFQMNAQELREHFKKLRQEYDRDPQSHLKALDRLGDIVNYYHNPDPAIIDMDHVRKTKENIYSFAQDESISNNQKIKGLKHYKTLFTHVLTELKAGNRIAGTILINSQEKKRYHQKELNYYLYHINYLIEFLNGKIQGTTTQENGPQFNLPDMKFRQQTANDWIYSDKLQKFHEIEKELNIQGFINADYCWDNGKQKLIDLLTVLIENEYFKKVVNGKKKQTFHYRQFISERYNLSKTGLTEISKKYKPSIEIAKASFFGIDF